MATAKMMIAMRLAQIRGTAGSDDEAAMNTGLYMNELAAELGALVATGVYTVSGYGTCMRHYNDGYTRATAIKLPPALTTTLSAIQLAAAELRFARIDKGLTQQHLGELAGLSNSLISAMENAKYSATETQSAQLRAALSELRSRLPPKVAQ